MGRTVQAKKAAKNVRLSVILPKDQHDELQDLANSKRVSLAWVVRDAVERYLDDQAPLFRRHPRET